VRDKKKIEKEKKLYISAGQEQIEEAEGGPAHVLYPFLARHKVQLPFLRAIQSSV
jgi:hypothetical protein